MNLFAHRHKILWMSAFFPLILTCQNCTSPSASSIASSKNASSPSSDDPSDNSATAFPDASNTGVLAGTTLTPYSGTMTITQNGTVVQNMNIVGNIVVQAANVTIKNSRITSNTPYHLVYALDSQAPNFTMINCELIGNGTTTNGVLGYGTFKANNIHGFENGLNIWAGLVQDNYIHDMQGNASSHYDGIEVNGSSLGLTIVHNTVVNEHDQTSALMFDNYYGSVANIKVDNNHLHGGGYVIYLDGRFNASVVDSASISFTNNVISGGYYGPGALYGNTPTWTGNVDENGQTLSRP